MSLTRWMLLLVTVGLMALLGVHAQRAAANLAYEKSRIEAEVRRLKEEKADLEARIDSVLTPESLAEHARRMEHLVPPGREQ
jgi:uncharacterized protein YceH (UPF0502 family)